MPDLVAEAYQNEESSLLAPALLGGAGFAAGYAIFRPASLDKISLSQYPRLQEMRKAARAGGVTIWSPSLAEDIRDLPFAAKMQSPSIYSFKAFNQVVGSTSDIKQKSGLLHVAHMLNPTKETRELLAFQKANPETYISGLLAPDIGEDKWATYKYLSKSGLSSYQPKTVNFEELLLSSDKEVDQIFSSLGGKENIITKERLSSLGKGVWLNSKNIPTSVQEDMLRQPHKYLFQEKLDLVSEFRVVTAGDKAIYSAHRFAPSNLKDFISNLSPNLSKKIEDSRMLENILPVTDRYTRKRLETFAETIAQTLPYEIGAFDIGLTRSGSFKLIEAQRTFGTLRNPIVTSRLEQVLSGTSRKVGIVAGITGALAAVGLYSLFSGNSESSAVSSTLAEKNESGDNIFSGRDDRYNTIEGLGHQGIASTYRKSLTDFGSGFDPVRQLAKQLGKSFEDVVGSQGFQKALSGATVEGVLGKSGSFGTVYRMSTEYQGSKLTFAKKVMHSYSDIIEKQVVEHRNIAQTAGNAFGETEEWSVRRSVAEYITGEGGTTGIIQKEARIQSQFADTFAPSVYRSKGSEMFMEHIPGRTVGDILKQGDKLDLPALKSEMQDAIYEVASKGFINTDIHAGNIMLTPKGQMAWIDWGEAITSRTPGFAREQMEGAFAGLTRKLQSQPQMAFADTALALGRPVSQLPAPIDIQRQSGERSTVSRAVTLLRSQDLQRAQREVWNSAVNGGKGHLIRNKNSSMVQSTSRFDTTVK